MKSTVLNQCDAVSFADEEGMLKYIMLINSGEKILPGSKRLESLLGTGNPDLLDFIQRRLQ